VLAVGRRVLQVLGRAPCSRVSQPAVAANGCCTQRYSGDVRVGDGSRRGASQAACPSATLTPGSATSIRPARNRPSIRVSPKAASQMHAAIWRPSASAVLNLASSEMQVPSDQYPAPCTRTRFFARCCRSPAVARCPCRPISHGAMSQRSVAERSACGLFLCRHPSRQSTGSAVSLICRCLLRWSVAILQLPRFRSIAKKRSPIAHECAPSQRLKPSIGMGRGRGGNGVSVPMHAHMRVTACTYTQACACTWAYPAHTNARLRVSAHVAD
jgi:hypothetical protein